MCDSISVYRYINTERTKIMSVHDKDGRSIGHCPNTNDPEKAGEFLAVLEGVTAQTKVKNVISKYANPEKASMLGAEEFGELEAAFELMREEFLKS